MKTVEAFEVETQLSALLENAERGETTLVTKDGRPVARIAPIESDISFREALKRLRDGKLKLGMPLESAIKTRRR